MKNDLIYIDLWCFDMYSQLSFISCSFHTWIIIQWDVWKHLETISQGKQLVDPLNLMIGILKQKKQIMVLSTPSWTLTIPLKCFRVWAPKTAEKTGENMIATGSMRCGGMPKTCAHCLWLCCLSLRCLWPCCATQIFQGTVEGVEAAGSSDFWFRLFIYRSETFL